LQRWAAAIQRRRPCRDGGFRPRPARRKEKIPEAPGLSAYHSPRGGRDRVRSHPITLVLLLAASSLAAQDYELGFSPGGGSLKIVLDAIASAKSSLLVACYEFTSREIAAAFEDAAHRGVKVRIVADFKASEDRYSQIPILSRSGIPIRLDRRYEIMHDKFMVIDGDAIETGSFNYSEGAVRHNAENALWEWKVADKAALYAAEWRRLWDESE
jgi:phosphatidylserine/phosphatidylglycerophosphate/cardiolipin synthase-like enzyme